VCRTFESEWAGHCALDVKSRTRTSNSGYPLLDHGCLREGSSQTMMYHVHAKMRKPARIAIPR
jgi:hypothetical protein